MNPPDPSRMQFLVVYSPLSVQKLVTQQELNKQLHLLLVIPDLSGEVIIIIRMLQ